MDIPAGAFINRLGVLEIPGSLYHFTHYVSPLRHAERLEEILDFPYPSVDGYLVDHMAEAARQAKAAGRVTCCHLVHMYEDAWQIRGYEPFLMDMLTNPEICAYILDQIADKNLKKAEAAARAGVDVLISGDDVANQRSLMFAPELWRRFIKERWARVYAAARAIKPDIQIWYHSDGNIMSILPELIEIGVTILNPVQPECMDLAAVKRLYGRQLVLDGTIGTQTTFPFGTPQDIRAVIQDRIENLGADGALMLSPTHVLEPEVPLENMLAFLEACQQK
jgi:uroporphyrinogen decarboxylase